MSTQFEQPQVRSLLPSKTARSNSATTTPCAGSVGECTRKSEAPFADMAAVFAARAAPLPPPPPPPPPKKKKKKKSIHQMVSCPYLCLEWTISKKYIQYHRSLKQFCSKKNLNKYSIKYEILDLDF